MDIKCTWKTAFVILSTILGVFAGVLAFDDRYVTAKEFARLEQQTVQTMKEFQLDMKKEKLEQRYITLSDQENQLKILKIKYPNDRQLDEQLRDTKQEREKVRKELETIR